MFYKRNITERIKKALTRSPAILLGGARQTGKTTLIQAISETEGHTYVTLDDFVTRSTALQQPQEFLEELHKPAILDEVQRVPELALAIKKDIDEHRIPGRYALTSSAHPLFLPKLADALVGRMETIKMYPLSQGELLGKKETFIDQIFSKDPSFVHHYLPKRELCNIMVRGGYPLVQQQSERARIIWFTQYLEQILLRDVQEIARIEGTAAMPKLLRLLAARVGNLLVVSELSRDADIVPMTTHRYLALLELIFLVVIQPAWSTNLTTRFKKSPKAYFLDTGLLTFLLNMNAEQLASSDHVGKVCENFVVQELWKQATWAHTHVNFHHMRAHTEVDIVLENRSGEVVGIEVKASETVTPASCKGLTYLKQVLGDRFIRGIVLYTGKIIRPFAKNIHAIPMSALWES